MPIHVDATGTPHLYLVTSRGSGRWIIPKGNPMRGLAPHKVAAREALEEAGLVGQIERSCIGMFAFSRRRGGSETLCHVDVYALAVERQMRRWAEAGQRSVLRCNLPTALSLISAPGLAALIEQYMSKLSPSGAGRDNELSILR